MLKNVCNALKNKDNKKKKTKTRSAEQRGKTRSAKLIRPSLEINMSRQKD